MRAAGRAILLLSDEIERLHIDLWHAGDRSRGEKESGEAPDESPALPADVPPERPPEVGLGVTLRERLALFRAGKASDR